MTKINPSIFKAYDIRGLYPSEISEEAAYRIAWGFGKFLKVDLKKELPLKIALGLDMRGSSPFLARQITNALNDQGIDVVDLGVVPTPAFYYAVSFKDFGGGIMVTASHNPKEYNGLKLCREKGRPIVQATEGQIIQKYAESEKMGKAGTRGKFESLAGITKEYVEKDLSYLDSGKIKKFKIVADSANGLGALYLEEFFNRVPSEAIKLNWDLNGNFPIHEANPMKIETLQQIQEVIRNEKADFGIATDGDGDRLGFLDEKGTPIRGDIITAIMAKVLLEKYPGSKIGYEVRSSKIVKETIEKNGGVPVMMPAGYAKMKPIMEEEKVLFAAESSMHYMFAENYNHESPIFVTASLLLLCSNSGKTFSEVASEYLVYHHSGEINFEIEDKEGTLARLEKKFSDGKILKLDGLTVEYPDWWLNIRPSNTENLLRLNLEADNEAEMRQKVDEITKLIKG